MLRAWVLGLASVFSVSSFAATVVCTNPELGTLTIKGAFNNCGITLQQPERMPWFSGEKRCTEIYDGAVYTISAELYSWGRFDPTLVTIKRGTTADIRFVQFTDTVTSVQYGGHELNCKMQ